MDYIECEDPLAEFDDTRILYEKVSAYLSTNYKGDPRITKDTPFPIVAVWINKCMRRFRWKKKPRKKVLYLCFKFLDSIGYPK
jgi:hypothetical protein